MLATNYVPPTRVLPTDGRLPTDSSEPLEFTRTGRLSCFADERSAFRAGKFLQAVRARIAGERNEGAENFCLDHGLRITNTMSEGTGSSGGYVVPAEISRQLIAVREQSGVTRRTAMVMPTSGDTLTIPKRSGGLTAYAPGEGQSITASDASLSQIELIVKKRAVFTQISQELNDDALISMADFVFAEMAYALAQQEDNEYINGTGAAATYFGVQGLLSSIGSAAVSQAATGHDTWAELDMGDVMACVGLLPDRYFDSNVGWICSYSFFNQVFARLAFAGGGVSASEILSGTGNVRSFAGYPVYLTSKMPTSGTAATVCALFGNFAKSAVLADRGGISLNRSDDFAFQADLISFKATTRYDIRVHEPGTASAVGGYVALKTAA